MSDDHDPLHNTRYDQALRPGPKRPAPASPHDEEALEALLALAGPDAPWTAEDQAAFDALPVLPSLDDPETVVAIMWKRRAK